MTDSATIFSNIVTVTSTCTLSTGPLLVRDSTSVSILNNVESYTHREGQRERREGEREVNNFTYHSL